MNKTKGGHLFLVLESYGGDPFSAVAIMNILQDRFQKITTIIPNHAKSAATLMALGTDEIYMHERASIGPLDLPVEHPKDGTTISALDIQQTVTNLSVLSESITAERYDFLRKDKKVSKKVAAHFALEYGTKFLVPIVAQIDPYHLQKASRELKIGWWYAIDMLLSRMMKGNVQQASNTARSLVNDWPAHEYAIFANDARDMLKLNVYKLDDLPYWKSYLEKEYNDKYANKNHRIVFITPDSKK